MAILYLLWPYYSIARLHPCLEGVEWVGAQPGNSLGDRPEQQHLVGARARVRVRARARAGARARARARARG